VKPRLLDLFCGAGGAAMGYHQAGWDVVGVDVEPQPHYPFEFIQADALTPIQAFEERVGYDFDAVHASPPCQAFSVTRVIQNNAHSDLLTPTRTMLEAVGFPWVIENVPGAPMRKDLVLCGTQFGLEADGFEVRRHRWFEFSDPRIVPMVMECAHRLPPVFAYGHSQDNAHKQRYGPCGADTRRRAMGVEWMNRDELAQAIPPAYTEFIGAELLRQLREVA
jgi:DNA (cytosine-5)-methyltransferase 1